MDGDVCMVSGVCMIGDAHVVDGSCVHVYFTISDEYFHVLFTLLPHGVKEQWMYSGCNSALCNVPLKQEICKTMIGVSEERDTMELRIMDVKIKTCNA